ncbi:MULTISPECIES: 5'/3'-nucleotidase SurE [unclassified Desulfovibrio]|uniref:5'/3'-nucleotidase SurE n=1 Tax=unclassified Desulfovibrio TaxID=2593640 RepID=UPI0013ECA29A|nr:MULTISPECIES: 5'/3'-nucleotidase SurE [unclassified Desulfovibrio]
MHVLLTNDDGILAPGLRALYAALTEAGHTVTAVAPLRQQSGVGHSLTVFEPLRTRRIDEPGFSGIGVHGTPTDCVKLGLGALSPRRPDLVMAGINLGPNVGPDIFYSGTVGAAAEGAHDGVASMAISHADHSGGQDLTAHARHAVALAERIDWEKIPARRVLNLNYPAGGLPEGEVRVCPQSDAVWRNIYDRREDPRGEPYWWLTGDVPPETVRPGTDKALLAEGHVTLTPLRFEYTDDAALEALAGLVAAPRS